VVNLKSKNETAPASHSGNEADAA